jgi:formylmethanofuran dehydrogenase subunit C
MIKLCSRYKFRFPVEAECITPDNFEDTPLNKISMLPIWEGNKRRVLGELFALDVKEIKPVRTAIQIFGDSINVKRIGSSMSKGEIEVKGNTGMHVGEGMKGGTIIVEGNVESWAGSAMSGGVIEIKGDAGHYIGAPYRGSSRGMRGGTIVIQGNAGNEVGCFMRGGTIKIRGDIGDFVGVHMRGGTIFVEGDSEGRAGAQMLGGKIVICGRVPSILPTFTIDGVKKKVKVDGEEIKGPFYKFIGDLADGGEGKLYVSQTKNSHLSFYEDLL